MTVDAVLNGGQCRLVKGGFVPSVKSSDRALCGQEETCLDTTLLCYRDASCTIGNSTHELGPIRGICHIRLEHLLDLR